jgi:transcriptional regulator with XRE-family HTH domain
VPLSPQRAFGARIRELRLAAGLTQEDLAERCGLFRTYLSQIENGRANPTLTMIHALATSLAVSVPALFTRVAPAPVKRTASRPSRGRVSR